MILFGLLLGAGLASYSILSPTAIGFAFPNINAEFSIRPTFSRIIGYIIGKGLGFIGIGLIIGWAGTKIQLDVVNRLVFGLITLLGLFIFMFAIMNESPEMKLAKFTDVSERSLPTFFLGLFSTFIFIAPNIIGWLWAFSEFQIPGSLSFFVNIFLGQIIILMPKILNMKWAKGIVFLYLTRLVLFFCTSIVLILSISRLLEL